LGANGATVSTAALGCPLNDFCAAAQQVPQEHRQVQRLKATVAQQQKQIAAQQASAAPQQKQIEALTATMRKVNERVELSAPTAQIAANED
jgi:uncharacterized coiled-coil protein SlyX